MRRWKIIVGLLSIWFLFGCQAQKIDTVAEQNLAKLATKIGKIETALVNLGDKINKSEAKSETKTEMGDHGKSTSVPISWSPSGPGGITVTIIAVVALAGLIKLFIEKSTYKAERALREEKDNGG